jgi:VWFA-related protein
MDFLRDFSAGITMVNRMFSSRSDFLALLLCLPGLTMAQTTPTPSPEPDNPTLVLRPPGEAHRLPSPISPEGRIHLDVLVSDAGGKPVPGLLPLDFTILDNNQPRKLLSFRSYDGINVKPAPPVEVILVVDTVNLPFQQISFIHQEIARFLRQNSGHLAQPVSLMLLSEAGLRIQPRPSVDGNALLTVLDQIKGSLHGITSAMGAEGDLQRLQLSLRQMTAIAENEALRPGRKLLIWVGPGWPMLDSPNFSFSDKDQRRYFDAIVELSTRMREARMVLYSVAPANSVMGAGTRDSLYKEFLKGVKSPRQSDTGNLALKVLAVQSGGRILGPDNDIVGQIDNCIADANAFYTLSFNPPAAEHADEYHDLKVAVSQAGLTVRTNTGYYNQPPTGPEKAN